MLKVNTRLATACGGEQTKQPRWKWNDFHADTKTKG
jgi:hypothetical protein